MKTMTSATGATGEVRLVQSRRYEDDGERLVLRVEIEGVEAPSIGQIEVLPTVTLCGALKPIRRYALTSKWYVVSIRETDDGVTVEGHFNARVGECSGYLLSLAWAGLLEQEIRVDVPWWPAVAGCQWDGEGGSAEVAA